MIDTSQGTTCADCGAMFVASGGATGYAVTCVPRFPVARSRHLTNDAENLGTFAVREPKDGESYLFRELFPALYDVEGNDEARSIDFVKNDGGTTVAIDGRTVATEERRICYACSAVLETETMIATGRASLYLTEKGWNTGDPYCGYLFTKPAKNGLRRYTYELSGWSGVPTFRLIGAVRESHGYGFGHRYDVRTFRFAGPDGYVWSGRSAGDMQLARCKRTKERTR